MEKKLPAFVYGTLRKGCGNYERLLEGNTTSIKKAKLEGFEMYSVGGFPAILEGEGTIYGEVMTINEDIYEGVLFRLDMLEGYNQRSEESSMYLRRVMKVTTEDGEEVDAYVYLWNRSIPGPKVESGDWIEYQNNQRLIY